MLPSDHQTRLETPSKQNQPGFQVGYTDPLKMQSSVAPPKSGCSLQNNPIETHQESVGAPEILPSLGTDTAGYCLFSGLKTWVKPAQHVFLCRYLHLNQNWRSKMDGMRMHLEIRNHWMEWFVKISEPATAGKGLLDFAPSL